MGAEPPPDDVLVVALVVVGDGIPDVLEVGVAGMAMQYPKLSSKPHPVVEPTAGFHCTNCSSEKVPNIATMSSHSSRAVAWYQPLHSLVIPSCTGEGWGLTVGTGGRLPSGAAQTQ